jgi:glutamyl-tRNA synthetase
VREQGYLPDAFLNFLAFLGWNPGSEQELFSIDELIKSFSIERIGKSGAKFDIQKANWFNQQYLKNKSDEALASQLKELLTENNVVFDEQKLERIVHAMKERVTFLSEFWTTGQYFFQKPTSYDEKVIRKKWNAEVASVLGKYADALEKVNHLDANIAKSTLTDVLEQEGMGMGKVMQSLRVSITGEGGGPDLMDIIEILGKEEITERIRLALTTLKDQE